MANPNKSVPQSVPGEFFVDTTCIDCDTCRQIAPQVFGAGLDYAFVHSQPAEAADRRSAWRALVSCPTGSIGSLGDDSPKQVLGDFPLPIAGPVFYCGFNSPKSYGGNSYFIQHPAGNWLVDSPKFLPQLIRRFDALGGIANIFLTHRDDVADAERYAGRFGSRRFIHRAELASQPGAEFVLEGDEPVELSPGFISIPTPGHTSGHCVLLLDSLFLFTGDHLAWDRDERRLAAHPDYCWHSWPRQIDSMRRLAEHRFEWILPGHGQRVCLPADEMRRQMSALLIRMHQQSR